ncbi:MAG: acyltransferase [Pseudomonadales bacterium]|uniref:Acyltransferase 3 n=1 Tax=Oleiphilus messinensis TaxID=141451 RepID=A0A1Y0I1M7_9GAMM|nr:acyltransferase [Oleiphilus messinensis]ARU54367.1 acyltransferase 3 [Oleiphilus messinensis]MCG8614283.1 acyltransferase [Pseudomonadales bacterium]
MKSSNLPYEPKLDHLRFLAALIVFLFHVYHFYYLKWHAHEENAWMGLIIEGHTGVSLFFVLSGFIFMQIALRSNEINYRQFMANRFLRIAPLFLVIFFVAISVGRDDFKGYYIFYTLFSNIGEAPTSGSFITGAAWTISVEFTFYMIFPFIARFFKEAGLIYVVRLFAILFLIKFSSYYVSERSTHMLYSTLIGRLDQFVLGMVFAYVLFHYRDLLYRFRYVLFPIAILAVYANSFIQAKYFSFFHENPKQLFWVTWSFQEALAWGFFVIGYMLLPLKIPALLNQFMTRVGEVSYSFYLLHGMVIFLVFNTLGPINLFAIDQINALVNAFVLFLLVWFVSHLSYQTIEKPFLGMRKRYVQTK